jgi:hypothetical protein
MSWNKDAAVRHLNVSAGAHSHRDCAKYTRQAIEAGGIKIGSTYFAKDYGPLLERAGFSKVLPAEIVRAGDVIVIQSYPGNDAGHMAMFNGTIWVSDFRQHADVYPGPGYRKYMPAYQIYRKN